MTPGMPLVSPGYDWLRCTSRLLKTNPMPPRDSPTGSTYGGDHGSSRPAGRCHFTDVGADQGQERWTITEGGDSRSIPFADLAPEPCHRH
jgi:hypothetical protein